MSRSLSRKPNPFLDEPNKHSRALSVGAAVGDGKPGEKNEVVFTCF